MKTVPVEAAVGMVLCHDVTEIVPGLFKGRAFKKGRVIRSEDIPRLLDMGKENIYVLDPGDGLHENAAARRIAAAAAGDGITLGEPVEGKVGMVAARDGLLKVDSHALNRINCLGDVMMATLHSNQQVVAGRTVAGTRIIPLVIDEEKIERVEQICREQFPLIQINPFRPFRVGLVTTGSEIYKGRIKDKFGPVVKAKMAELGSHVFRQIFVSDDVRMTVDAIRELIDQGADMITVTGGMSVDPDDQTPASIKAAGASVVTYGAPVLPGAMFMLAHIGTIPIVGLPGCVMYYDASVFDLVVPRILAGETVTREDIAAMGHGGLCANCSTCYYPLCPFGKGS